MKKPLILGSVHTKISARVKDLPRGNEEYQMKSATSTTDGAGFRFAYIAKGLGFEYELMAPVGTGVYADQVRSDLESIGMDVKYPIEAINGCTYTMTADNGEESSFIVPGGEYSFNRNWTEELYPDEIGMAALYGEMLTGELEDTADIIETLEDLEKPVYFMPQGRSEELMKEILDAVYALEPVMYLTDTDAYYLADEYSGELRDTALKLIEKTKSPVMILKQGEGCFYMDSDESYMAPCERKIDADLHIALYLCALEAGVDKKNALMFANEFAQYENGALPDAYAFKAMQDRLAHLILQK